MLSRTIGEADLTKNYIGLPFFFMNLFKSTESYLPGPGVLDISVVTRGDSVNLCFTELFKCDRVRLYDPGPGLMSFFSSYS